MHLSTFGWTPFFEQHSAAFRDQRLQFDRVNWLSRGVYHLFSERGEQHAQLSGRLRHQATRRCDLPAVGDWVAFFERDGACMIQAVLAQQVLPEERRARNRRADCGCQCGQSPADQRPG
jgi:ribosome biogenesis GTPase / thiamine phosphate phosphatase